MEAPLVSVTGEHRLGGDALGLPILIALGSMRARSAQRLLWHAHPGYEFLFLLEGKTAYEFESGPARELSGGQFLLIPKGARHRGGQDYRMPSLLCGIQFDPAHPNACENSVFSPEDLESMEAQLSQLEPCLREMPRELSLLIKTLQEAVPGFVPGGALPLEAASLRALVCRIVLEANRLLAAPPRGDATSLVTAAREYLEKRHAETLRMNALAAHLGLSRARMFELFRSETGLSPNDYLQRFRIESAKQLLLLGEGSITDIAMATGFTSSQYFSRVFLRYCGRTPQQFRRQRRGAE
jgi:AraC-like DNA-binding protein